MVKIVTVGSIAFDSIKTPFGAAEKVIGGSAVFSSLAAGLFAKTGVVGVVGTDFGAHNLSRLEKKGVDVQGVTVGEGKTFSWKGFYEYDMNVAHTVETNLNVFSSFDPVVPESYRKADFLFLGNISPKLQLSVLEQMKKRPKLVVSDTMNYYIEREPENVKEVIKEVDIGLMNDAEARQLFGTPSLVQAAKKILELDSKYAIIKKGEHGAVLFSHGSFFSVPAFPLEKVVDPTGCGDSFAGAFLGFLAIAGKINEKNIRKAMVYGSAVASINAQDFSISALEKTTRKQVEKRFKEFRKMVEF